MKPIDRREFLGGILALGALGSPGRGSHAALQVAAHPTVFFGTPDARTALVRFVADGTDAPAGRLRVFDQARRQVGTAGMLGVSGRLYGELWLPLERDTTYVTELELPRIRGATRTVHRLQPRHRWTIHWITLPPAANLDGAEYLDHAAYLGLLRPADGSTLNAVSFEPTGSGAALPSLPLLLAGSGLRMVIRRGAAEDAPTHLRGRDGSRVTLTLDE